MADIKQVYPKIQGEVNRLEAEITVAEDNIRGFKRTTDTMEWHGDARERVEPILVEICNDMEELRKFITDMKVDAGETAEKMQEASAQNVSSIESIKNA